MSAIFRKTASNDIEVNIASDQSPVLLARSFRMVKDRGVDLALWLDAMNCASYIALRNPCIQMLDNVGGGDDFGMDGDNDDSESQYMRYNGVVLLYIPELNYRTEPSAYLIDLHGHALAGSNAFEGGRLCLGDTFNPFTLQAAELLLHNSANDDLAWQGDMLGGHWENGMFITTIWPTLSHIKTPPDAILADIRRWWPT